jgi:tetratricopeptide (TPR) repeat protein
MSIAAGRTLGKYIGKIAFFFLCVTLCGWSQEVSLDYLVGQGQIHEAHGEFAQAERLFLEALRAAERPPSSPLSVAGILVNLGALDTEQARYLDAERLFFRALALAQRAGGPKSYAVAQVLWHLIGLYVDAGHGERMNPLLRQYQEIAMLNLPADSLERAESLGNMGRIYLSRNDSRKALPLFQKAVEIVESHHADKAMPFIRVLLDRAAASGNLGHTDDALSDLARASAIVSGMADPAPQILIDLQVTSGLVYLQASRGTEAEASMKSALQIAESHYGANHPVVAFVLRNCGSVLRKFGKKQEASIDRERANRIMAANAGASPVGNSINAFLR